MAKYGLDLAAAAAVLLAGFQVRADLLVGSQTFASGGAILRYSSANGAYLGVFASGGSIADPLGMTFGPDGNLYAACQGGIGGVLRFDGKTGALIDSFIGSGSGGLDNPFGIAFSPVPEPSLLALCGLAGGLVSLRRRRTRV